MCFQDFNAKLSDLGLAKLVPADGDTYLSTCIVGTYGRLYVKSNVYGFGAVMLEIITGLQVVGPNRRAMKRNLVDWARPFLRNKKRLRSIM
ncbi:putative non-specific serine/threonine protein kinase [Helianthus anomalus]